MYSTSQDQMDVQRSIFFDSADSSLPINQGTLHRLPPGTLVAGRYEVKNVLGQGGMGIVYLCCDHTTNEDVALKSLLPELSFNSTEMNNILANFNLVHKLYHPYIAAYTALIQDDNGEYYLVMEYVEGTNLQTYLAQARADGSFSAAMVLKFAGQLAEALDFAHKRNILHRDVKPANVIVDNNGDVKLLDFGLAAQIRNSIAKVSMNRADTGGTMPYMAPEQWLGEQPQAATDQYALAATVYEMFSTHPPFDSASEVTMRECALHKIPQPLTGVDSNISSAVARALHKVPGKRFATCKEFTDAMAGSSKKVPGRLFLIPMLIIIALISCIALVKNIFRSTPVPPSVMVTEENFMDMIPQKTADMPILSLPAPKISAENPVEDAPEANEVENDEEDEEVDSEVDSEDEVPDMDPFAVEYLQKRGLVFDDAKTAIISCKNQQLRILTLPDGITAIGSNAFHGCKNLEKVDISSSVKKVGQNAFSQCTNLKLITIPPHLATASKSWRIPKNCRIVVMPGLSSDFINMPNPNLDAYFNANDL